MRNYQYINRERVNPIDLNLLGQTYNTLEQGHLKAVEAASELQTAMASLDLNEAEDAWRQQRINEIRQTIADNTTFGNAYGALDDIIAKRGDLTSDAGLIGRLRAQQDYKAYQESIDKAALPEDYKEMYRELNPYYYNEKIDEKTGKVISTSKWKPTKTPTAMVALSDLITKGISWASEDSGTNTITRWLNKDGKVTTNPEEAFDGEVFNVETRTWERLGREKILQGIKAAIETTPGAKESLQQDYDVANWRHNKYKQANPNSLAITDITDANGNILNPEQYLLKRLEPALMSKTYNNSTVTTSYGNGLKTYKAAQRVNSAESAIEKYNPFLNNELSTNNSLVEVKVDSAATYLGKQADALSKLKSLTGIDLDIDPNKPIDDINDIVDVTKYDREMLYAINQQINEYNDAYDNLQAYRNLLLDDASKKEFDFSTRLKAGRAFLASENGGSKYDDKGIELLNNLYRNNGSYVQVTINDDKSLQHIINVLNSSDDTDYKSLGIEIKNNKIIIPKESSQIIPFISNVIEAKNKDYSVEVFDNNKQPIDNITISTNYPASSTINGKSQTVNKDAYSNKRTFNKLGDLYSKANDISKNILSSNNVASDYATVQSLNLSGENWTEKVLFDSFKKGLIDKQTYDESIKFFGKTTKDAIIGHDWAQKDLYYSEETGGIRKRIVSPKERLEIGQKILKIYEKESDNVVVSPTIIPGRANPVIGSNITAIDEEGNKISIFVPNFYNESVVEAIQKSPIIKAWNEAVILGETKASKRLTNINTNPTLGNIVLKGVGAGSFEISGIFGSGLIDQSQAQTVIEALNNYQEVKARMVYGLANEENVGRLQSTLQYSVEKLANVFNIDENYIYVHLMNDINNSI